jgi:glycosyltransferase involved in cell wall biosynthesis
MATLPHPLRLSVVIPCLNAAATIGVQLEALAGQSWEGEWEVVVADNGSTDGSQAIVESYRGPAGACSQPRGGGGLRRRVPVL